MPLSRRQFIIASAALLASAPLLRGCARAPQLRLGIHHWIGYESLYLAMDLGLLPEQLVLHEGLVAGDSMQALQAGEVDAACLTLDEALRVIDAGVPLRVLLIFNLSAGADMLLVHPQWQSETLAGARLGVEKGALGALVLRHFLNHSGLTIDQLQLLDLPPDRQLAMWQAGAVDAMVSYHPTALHLQQEGGRILFDSRQMPETIFDVLAVREDRLALHSPRLRQLLEAHFAGLMHVKMHRQDALYRIAGRQQLTPVQVQQSLGDVVLPGLEANRRYLSGQNPALTRVVSELNDLMLAEGLLNSAVDPSRLFSAGWLPAGESRG